MGNRSKQYFMKENSPVAYKKMLTTSLIIQGMQIKIMRFHYVLTRTAS